MYNNKAIDLLKKKQFIPALHNIKLAISLSPNNADSWVNFGVILKREKQENYAKFTEFALLNAFKIDKNHHAAISNLERFYQEQGYMEQAQKFNKQAQRVRFKNPYYQYRLALKKYRAKRYSNALKIIKRAISLHNKDPLFYELKSFIFQQQRKYKIAYKNLKKAQSLASNSKQRTKYADKAALVYQQTF